MPPDAALGPLVKYWMNWILGGTIVGCLAAYGVVKLGAWGIESSGWFSLLTAFVLGPFIIFASMPWSLLLPNSTGNAITLAGLSAGLIINGGLLGAFLGMQIGRRRRATQSTDET